jgi:hypothetical protein
MKKYFSLEGGCKTEAAGKQDSGQDHPGRLRQIKPWRCVMKTIQRLTTVLGLSLVLVALGATGARGQVLDSTQLVGTFTLPISAQWGSTTLPAGDYTLRYGTIYAAGGFVEVRGLAKGSPHGVIRVDGTSQSSAAKSELICVREGATLIIRALDMPLIGKVAEFSMPRGTQLTAHNGQHNRYTQLAEAPMLIQRIRVTLNAK